MPGEAKCSLCKGKHLLFDSQPSPKLTAINVGIIFDALAKPCAESRRYRPVVSFGVAPIGTTHLTRLIKFLASIYKLIETISLSHESLISHVDQSVVQSITRVNY